MTKNEQKKMTKSKSKKELKNEISEMWNNNDNETKSKLSDAFKYITYEWFFFLLHNYE
jgi:hypothetical protein